MKITITIEDDPNDSEHAKVNLDISPRPKDTDPATPAAELLVDILEAIQDHDPVLHAINGIPCNAMTDPLP